MADKDVLTVKIQGETDVDIAAAKAAQALAGMLKEQQRASNEAARLHKEEVARRREAEQSLKEFQDKMVGYGKTIMGAFGVGLGFHELISFLNEGRDLFLEMEKAGLRLEAVVRATGQAAGFSGAELKTMAGRFSREMPMFGDQQFMAAEAVLGTYPKVKGPAFEETIKLSADLAAVMSGDVVGAAHMLGKALEEPEQGLSALRRAGIIFSEAEKAQIAAMAEMGHAAEAQQIILEKLRGTIGGVAEEMGKGKAGQFEAWRHEVDKFKRDCGELWAAFEIQGVHALQAIIDQMNRWRTNAPPTQLPGGGESVDTANPLTRGATAAFDWIAETLAGRTTLSEAEENRRQQKLNEEARAWAMEGKEKREKEMPSLMVEAAGQQMAAEQAAAAQAKPPAGPPAMALDIAGVLMQSEKAMVDWVALMKLDGGAISEVLKSLHNTHDATLAQIIIKEKELKNKSSDLAKAYGEAARKNLEEMMEGIRIGQEAVITKMKYGMKGEGEQAAIAQMMEETRKIEDAGRRAETQRLRTLEIQHQFRPEAEGTEEQRQKTALSRGGRLLGMWEQEQSAMAAKVAPIESLWLRRAGKAEETKPPTAEQLERLIKVMEDEDEKAQTRLRSAIDAIEKSGTFSKVSSIYGQQVHG